MSYSKSWFIQNIHDTILGPFNAIFVIFIQDFSGIYAGFVRDKAGSHNFSPLRWRDSRMFFHWGRYVDSNQFSLRRYVDFNKFSLRRYVDFKVFKFENSKQPPFLHFRSYAKSIDTLQERNIIRKNFVKTKPHSISIFIRGIC